MKRILTVMMIVVMLPLCACDEDPTAPERTVIPGSLNLRSQADVDLCGGIVEVMGDVHIDTYLDLDDPIRDLSPLSDLEIIHGDLYIRDNLFLEDLTEVSSLHSVFGYLDLDEDACDDFTGGLPALRKVQRLVLRSFMWNETIVGFVDFDIVDELYLRSVNGMVDFSWLGPQPTLKVLDLDWVYGLDSLAGLENLDSLERIELGNLPDLIDFGDMPSLPRLEYLNVHGCESLVDLSGLGALPSLRDIRISYSGLTSLTGIYSAPMLTYVYLGSLSMLQTLDGLPSSSAEVRVVCTSITGVTDLSPLTGLGTVGELTVEYCEDLVDLGDVAFSDSARLQVYSCDSLTGITGMMTGTVNTLTLFNNDALVDAGTIPLVDDMWTYRLEHNDLLETPPSIDGTDMIQTFSVVGNPHLDQCEMEAWGASVCTSPEVSDNGPCTTR